MEISYLNNAIGIPLETVKSAEKIGQSVNSKTGEISDTYAIAMKLFPIAYDIPTRVSRHTTIICLDRLLVNVNGEIVATQLLALYKIIEFQRDLGYQ